MSKWKKTERVLPPYDAPLKIRWRGDRKEYDATMTLLEGANAWMVDDAPYDYPPDEWRLADKASRHLFLVGMEKSFPFFGGGLFAGALLGVLGIPAGWLLLAFGVGMWLFTAWTYSAGETMTAKANSQGGAIAISTLILMAIAIPSLYFAFLILRFVFAGGPMPAVLEVFFR